MSSVMDLLGDGHFYRCKDVIALREDGLLCTAYVKRKEIKPDALVSKEFIQKVLRLIRKKLEDFAIIDIVSTEGKPLSALIRKKFIREIAKLDNGMAQIVAGKESLVMFNTGNPYDYVVKLMNVKEMPDLQRFGIRKKKKNAPPQISEERLEMLAEYFQELLTFYKTAPEICENHKEAIKKNTEQLKMLQEQGIYSDFTFESEDEYKQFKSIMHKNIEKFTNDIENSEKIIDEVNEKIKRMIEIIGSLREIVPEIRPVCKVCLVSQDWLWANKCGHLLCAECKVALEAKEAQCPTCKSTFHSMRKIYV